MATDDEDDVDKEEVEADVNDGVDHTFDHLDQIIDGTSAFEADELAYRFITNDGAGKTTTTTLVGFSET